ncbi:DUF805 domain-containing protein [uncultured Deinococcus sp.]|uniref:DUF805 domain-containing protein n=1 Tax=uncultured Deinococcus sp. TaxID=158789 RepID=UPI00258D540C|nr:DUF805 domain-containing protein [uncultured Deinococcus sp.]
MNTYLNVLRQYARFGGRARRREYWTFVLVNTLVGFGLTRLAGYLSPDLGVRGPSLNVGTVLYWVFTVATALPTLAVTVRRLHDTGRSGWWLLGYVAFLLACFLSTGTSVGVFSGLLFLLGLIVMAVSLAQNSAPGRNRWGDSPKGEGVSGLSSPR